jgi:hypothetical protein
MSDRSACYLLIAEAPAPVVAERIAAQYGDCPYVHFIAAFGQMLIGVWYLPETQRFWLEMVAEEPRLTLGLARATVYRTDHPAYPEALGVRVGDERSDAAPCGSDCRECERWDVCRRCPATHQYGGE